MQLSDQVCSLELARRLKELGVKQESCFYWCNVNNWEYKSILRYCENATERELRLSGFAISAFTVAELGEMLPVWQDSCKREINEWHVRVFEKDIIHNSFHETEADARAKMLIYLIENKLMEVPK